MALPDSIGTWGTDCWANACWGGGPYPAISVPRPIQLIGYDSAAVALVGFDSTQADLVGDNR